MVLGWLANPVIDPVAFGDRFVCGIYANFGKACHSILGLVFSKGETPVSALAVLITAYATISDDLKLCHN